MSGEAAAAAPPGAGHAADLRQALAGQLAADGWISTWWVRDAFRAVPREAFLPRGTPLTDAYGSREVAFTSAFRDGRRTVSVAAPWLQARMLAQAGVQPAMRVLQVGTCGCTAALLAEAAGPHGQVVSADPDPEVTAHARAALNAAGYGQRVTLVTAPPRHGVPGHAPFDAIIVTGSVQDIQPCWTGQLGPGGTLVVPLRLGGVTRLAGLRCSGGHLASTSLQACDLAPAHWAGTAGVQAYVLRSPRGGQVRVQFEDDAPGGFEVSCRALGSEPASAWPGVTLASGEGFADLPLWLAGRPGYCQVSAVEGAVLGRGLSGWWGRDWHPSGITRGESIAILGLRPTGWTSPVTRELGAWAYGPDARQAADDLATEILAWDRRGRSLPETALAYWPRGAGPGPASPGSVVFEQAHGTTTITWPTDDRPTPGRN